MIDQFARQNRWWADPKEITGDRHLVRLQESRLVWSPELPFRFDQDTVYTLRGPRQVGKSTVLKRQIQQLLAGGWPARKVLYLDVELAGLQSGRDLVAAMRWYMDSQRSTGGAKDERCAIFLDEVTRVDNWAGALRGLIDNNELEKVTLVATGSHQRDLRAGGERLPGRRGGGPYFDWELLPLSFREYVQVAEPDLQLPPVLSALTVEEVKTTDRELVLLRPRLISLLEDYLSVGGFPMAINDKASSGMIRAEIYQIYREAIIGEFTRAGMREPYLREIINWFADHLGQEFDYRDIALATDIGSKDTARNYMDNLEASYVAKVYYRTPDIEKLSPAFRGSKKIHPIDPLFWHLIRAWAASDPDPWPASIGAVQSSDGVGHLVESVIAIHLRRTFGSQVYYWRANNRREIDFAVSPPGAPVAILEVKYRQNVSGDDVKQVAKAGGGLVATRSKGGDLLEGAVYAIPAAELLVMLDAPSLGPSKL